MHQMKQIPSPFCWCLEINYFKDDNFGNSSFEVTPCMKEVLQTAATFWERCCAWSWQKLWFGLGLQGDAAPPLYGEVLGPTMGNNSPLNVTASPA